MPDSDTQRTASSTESTETPDFSQFKTVREWQFEIGGIIFEGSEPTGEGADQQVGEIVAATGDAGLLYYKALTILHDAPTIPEDEWAEFTPSSRARIASRHLENFGLKDFIDPQQFDELVEEMSSEARRGVEEANS